MNVFYELLLTHVSDGRMFTRPTDEDAVLQIVGQRVGRVGDHLLGDM